MGMENLMVEMIVKGGCENNVSYIILLLGGNHVS
jgi:hypothetical protein